MHRDRAYPYRYRTESVHAYEAANCRKRHQAAAQQQSEENQRTMLEPSSGAMLEQVEQAIAPQIEDDGHECEIQDSHWRRCSAAMLGCEPVLYHVMM